VSSSPSYHKNPYKNLKESSTRESKLVVKIDYEHIMPDLLQESTVTPSTKTRIPSTKCDIPSTPTIDPFPSSTLKYTQPSTIEHLQQDFSLQRDLQKLRSGGDDDPTFFLLFPRFKLLFASENQAFCISIILFGIFIKFLPTFFYGIQMR
jgi:hypothetical protein